jgi:hypothetical protein
MAQDAVGGAGDGFKLQWETLLGIVGAAAALGLWINVVGGAVLWTRFHEADLPATHIVGLVPNTTLIGLGLQALALPLLVAIVAVSVFYVVLRDRAATRPGRPAPTGTPGFGLVLVLLLVLAAVAIYFTFGGRASLPDDTQYLVAWVIASPFLILGAATYEPFARWVTKRASPRGERTAPSLIKARTARLYGELVLISFAAVMIFGALIGHGRAVFYVALLFPLAGLLAYLLPPGKTKLTTAGGWLVTGYILLAVALFFGSGGSVDVDPEGKDGAIFVAVLVTSLALLFLHVVGERSSNAHLVAATMFAVVAAWGGVINYLKERVTEPSFDLTAVVRKPASATAPREPVSGFLIARTGDAILVADDTPLFVDGTRRILVVPREVVESMSVGPACIINRHNLDLATQMASELQTLERGDAAADQDKGCTTRED